jgi:hypothetical protein
VRQLALDLGDRQASDVIPLKAGQDRRREAGRLGRGEHEHDEVGRFLERLEQRVPGIPGDLVRLVEDVDLAPQVTGRISEPVAQVADLVDAAVRGRIDLEDVERRAFADSDARLADITRVPILEVRAVDGLGEDPRQRRLAGPPRPLEQDGVGDTVGADGVAEGLDDRFLADDLAEGLGAPASIQRLMRCGRGHDLLRSKAGEIGMPCTLRRSSAARAHHAGRLRPGRSAAPDDDRLVLLPSGPDTVRGSPLRGTRSSTSLRRAATENGDLERGFGPAGADCRLQGTASSPPSTAPEV